MRHPSFERIFLLSGLFAAAVIGGLVLYGVSRRPAPTPAAPPVASPPQAPPVTEPATNTPKVYSNAALGFTVGYPDSVIPTEDKQDMQLSGYIPVCDPDTAVVCFPYGKDQMPGKNFEGAAFSVHVLPALKTETECQAAGNGEQEDGAATIGGLSFRKFAYGDAAMSHQLSGENYRYFRNGTCFQLSTDIFTTTFEVYAPGMVDRFTDADRSAVQHLLDAMLSSFRFE